MINLELCGGQFSGDSLSAWRALLAGFYGLPLGEEELALFQRITSLPGQVQALLLELWLAVGRKGRTITDSGVRGLYVVRAYGTA